MRQARDLTVVQIVYRRKRVNHRIRFGAPAAEARLDWRRKLVAFAPGSVFGYIRWRANRFGTQDWRLFVLRTVSDGTLAAIPGVMPGADILLATRGVARTKRALITLDALENDTASLASVSPTYWRQLHNRLAVSMDAHEFSPLQALSVGSTMS